MFLLLENSCEYIRLTLKRRRWNRMLTRCGRYRLKELLRDPDPELEDLIWSHYINRDVKMRLTASIVYDDSFCYRSRLQAGTLVMAMARQRFDWWGCLPWEWWMDPSSGRLPYVIGTMIYLPELEQVGWDTIYSMTGREIKSAHQFFNW